MGHFQRPSSDGSIRTTSPAIQPNPSVSLYTRGLLLAINCIPTQMPRKGRPFCSTRLDHCVVDAFMATQLGSTGRKGPVAG